MTHSDQLRRIRSALMDVKDRNGQAIVTLDVPGKHRKFVQVLDKLVNASYPSPAHPNDTIRDLSPYSKMLCIEEWKPHVFALLSFEVWDLDALALWIDQYFIRILECDADTYDLAATVAHSDTENSNDSLDTTFFHPGQSYIDDSGAIIMKAGGYTSQQVWDGSVIVDREHPNYTLWLWVRSQGKYQPEDTMVTDRDLETLRQEFVAASAKQDKNTSKKPER